MRTIGDSGIDADVGTVDMAAVDMGVPDPDVSVPSPHCDSNIGYGLLGDLASLSEQKSHSPRAVWTGTEWGTTWIVDGDDDAPSTVWFQRLNGGGTPIGSPAEIGKTESSQHEVVSTGEGFVVAYLNARRSGDQFSGIRLRVVGADGRAAVSQLELDGTFDVQSLAFSWAPFAGGMLVYSRGRQGSNGVYSMAIDPRFTVQSPVRISGNAARATAVQFGDGGWGAAWLAQTGAGESELTFVLLDENGGVIDSEETLGAGGVGPLSMAYGQGTFAIAWSRRVDGALPKPFITLLEAGGDAIGTPPIAGPPNMGLAHDIAWTGTAGFAVAWLATLEGGRTQAGVTRISALGIPNHPVLLPLDEGAGHRTVNIAGNQGNLGLWLTVDPAPPAVGFSAGSRAQVGRLGACN